MAKIQKSPACPKRLPKIAVYNRQKDLPLDTKSVRRAVKELCDLLSIVCESLSFYFVTEKVISSLHEKFFQNPSPTDCITFPIDAAHLGEVFVCPKRAIAYKASDPYQELLLYIVHGILHLIGYDDLKPSDRKAMRKMERKCMDNLMIRGVALGPISS